MFPVRKKTGYVFGGKIRTVVCKKNKPASADLFCKIGWVFRNYGLIAN
jgi:hypothetical protein